MPTYTKVKEVKDIISTGEASHNILADGAVDDVILQHEDSQGKQRPNKDMLFDPDSVTVGNDFHGSTSLKIEFVSSTEFEVYETHEALQGLRLVSSGNQISNDWTHPNKSITIKSGAWNGTIEQGDIVNLDLKAYLSEDMIGTRVEDTEVVIDSKLKSSGVKLTEKSSDNNRLFKSGSVPDEISVACKYLTAYYIYTDVYKDKFQDKSSDELSYTKRWKRRAEELVQLYVDEKSNIAPMMGSFPPVIDRRGVDDDLGPGVQEFQEGDSLENVDHPDDHFEDWY